MKRFKFRRLENLKNLGNKSGFTLVECVIAIAVFSILAMLVASLLQGALTAHSNNLHDTRSLREQRRLLTQGHTENRANNAASPISFNFGGVNITYGMTAIVADENAIDDDTSGRRALGDASVDFGRGPQLNGFRHNGNSTNTQSRPSGTAEVAVSFARPTGHLWNDTMTFNFGAPSNNDMWAGLSPHGTNSVVRSAYTVSFSSPGGIPPANTVWNTAVFPSAAIPGTLPSGDAVSLPSTIYANIIEIEVGGYIDHNIPEWVQINIPVRDVFPTSGAPHPRVLGVISMENPLVNSTEISNTANVGYDTINMMWHPVPPEQFTNDRRHFTVYRIAILTAAPIEDIPAWIGLRDPCTVSGCQGFLTGGVCSLLTNCGNP